MLVPSCAALIGETVCTAADRVEDLKKLKYQDIKISHHLVPIAIETSGVMGAKARSFLFKLGRRIKEETGERNAYFYLFHRISVALQRGNEVPVVGWAMWHSMTFCGIVAGE